MTRVAGDVADISAIHSSVFSGLVLKQGKFSVDEDEVIKASIERYRAQHDLDEGEILGIVFAAGRDVRRDHAEFWTNITSSLVDRSLASVYHHVKRILQPDARQGPWSEEEDRKLRNAIAQHGSRWENVSKMVGRWALDCRDRYRNHIKPGPEKHIGKWTLEEEDQLREIVTELKSNNDTFRRASGYTLEDEPEGGSEMFWSQVSKRFNGTRTRHQCRMKWNDNMKNKPVTRSGRNVRWSKRDVFILTMK